MDPFEEFEMKPITEGLGFHKKALKLNKENEQKNFVKKPELGSLDFQEPKKETSRLSQPMDALDQLLQESNKSLDKQISMTNPLPRQNNNSNTPETKSAATMELPFDRIQPIIAPVVEPLTDLNPRAPLPDPSVLQNDLTQRGASDSLVDNLKPVSVSFASSLLDIFVVLAISLVFMVTFLLATGTLLETVISAAQSHLFTQIVLAVFYISIFQMYIVVSRSFFGKTLGEWTFEYQMGDDKQIEKSSYPFKVIARSFVLIFTGIIVLPILSFLFRKDLSYYITGLQLYRRR